MNLLIMNGYKAFNQYKIDQQKKFDEAKNKLDDEIKKIS